MIFCRVKNHHGFTLTEMMITVAIIGIMAGIGIPNFIAWNQKYNLKAEVSKLAQTMNLARMTAINQTTPVTVTINQAAGGPVNVTFTDPALNNVLPTINMNPIVALSDLNGNKVGGGLVLSPQTVQFNAMGLYVNTGNANNICSAGSCTSNPPPQVLNFRNPRADNYRIVIQSTGKVVWCYSNSCVR